VGNFNDVQFGSFGDHRDEYRGTEQPYFREEVYQPPGSKNRFALHESNGSVTARRIGKPDSVLPGGRPAKQIAGGISVWGGGTGSPEGHKEILRADVRKGFRGNGLSQAMLKMAVDRHPNLSHSAALTPEGARFAARNPLPGDTKNTKQTQARNLVADAATALLGGPRRTGQDH
jgi:hypothetical protein